MKTKLIVFGLIFSLVVIFSGEVANAATLPLPGVEILFKSVLSKQVTLGKADENGNFNTEVKEANGEFDIFIGDENLPPVRITSRGNTISGRIVILTDGTTTKDPAPVVIKKPITKKVKAKAPSQTTKSN